MTSRWNHTHQDQYASLQWVSHPSLTQRILEVVGVGQRLLEMGAGTGALISKLQDHYSELRAIEYDPEMAKQIPKEIPTSVGRLEDHELDGWADCVLLRNVLHYTEDPDAALRAAKRALRPGGKLVLVEGVPPTSSLLDWYTELFGMIDDRHIFSDSDLIHHCHASGFFVERVVPVWLPGIDLKDWVTRRVAAEKQQWVLEHHAKHMDLIAKPYNFDGQTMDWRFSVLECRVP